MSELTEIDAGFAELEELAAGQTQGPTINVRFYVEAQENEQKSKAAGRRVFEDVDMVEKRIPGDRDEIRRPVTDEDKREFPAKYLAFKRNQSQEAVDGFPIRKWALVTKGEAETFVAAGIRTVEHLANAADVNLQHIGPYTALRQKARDWLKQQKEGAEVAKLRTENDDLRARLVALEGMVAKQSEEIALARVGGGVLPPAPIGHDPRIAEMQAQIAALAALVQPVVAPPPANPPAPKGTVYVTSSGEEFTVDGKGGILPPPKRRGRPPGSKNKPKAENGA